MGNLFDIRDKVVVITGGAGILGKGISAYLASQGAIIVILDRDVASGEKLAAQINNDGSRALFLATDVMNEEILKQNSKTIIDTYSHIDILLNAAGGNMPGATIAPESTIFDLDMEAMKKVVELNLYGTILPSVVFAKAMKEQGKGVIVNFSSMSALRPLTRVAGYGTAKAAVTNFTKYLAGELARKFGEGFRVNAIAPGFFLTDQNRSLLTNPDGTYTERAENIIAHTPFGRFGEAEELLGTIHYLISDASKFVTGTVAIVDGGFDSFSI